MDWLTDIHEAIDYIEANLLTIESPDEIARHIHIPAMYLQNGFRVMTGFTVWEYIRNRRLYNAALELSKTDRKVIDVALDHGYETPESFTKAFTRFHGVSPSEVRRDSSLIKTFLPLRIIIHLQGGNKMDYSVENMGGFKVIGISEEFSFESSQTEIPKFWERFQATIQRLFSGGTPVNESERAILRNHIGEFGVCIDDIGDGRFRYMIAGWYMGGEIPDGMELYELPAMLWAKFRCYGPMPDALQSVNRSIWNEWLPGNHEYELAGQFNIEWYSPVGKTSDPDYQSAIWIPVVRK